MLQSIHIQSFKGFKDTEIGPFKKVNLILGGQNVGKTSLLEAVYASTTGDAMEAMNAGGVFRLFEGNDQQRYCKSALGSPQLNLWSRFDDGVQFCIASQE